MRAVARGRPRVAMAKTLKPGVNTGYWAGGPPPGAAETIAEAERLGADSIWTAEAYGSDCPTPLAWWGASTTRLKLGTAIVQMSARQPAATAMAAMTMDHLSGGRFILGLGVSGPQVVEGWYEMPFEKPLARTRGEYIGILRDIPPSGHSRSGNRALPKVNLRCCTPRSGLVCATSQRLTAR
jgi:alkanesulfonate monooxygenase SsuD/methylene tetrahydromethanopterin reductase-like flavin-dependent oxidoreductase (luciferase family)